VGKPERAAACPWPWPWPILCWCSEKNCVVTVRVIVITRSFFSVFYAATFVDLSVDEPLDCWRTAVFFSWSHLLLDFRTAVEFTARPIWASFVTHYILMLLTSFVVRPLCLSTSDSCVTDLQKLVNCHEGNLPFPVLSSTPLPASSLPFPLSFLSLSPFPLSPPTIPTSDSCVTGLLTLVNCHEGHLPFPVLSSTPLPASSLPSPLSFQLPVWAAWRGSVGRFGSFNVIRLDLHTWILDILM